MADVGATLVSWSSTTSSNNPAGTTSVSTGLDDNLREIQGVVTRGLSHKGADIASATTTDLGAVEGLFHDITGTTTITGFGTVRAGIWKILQFDGALTLTHNATSLILPGNANITTATGDMLMATSEGSGNWRVNWFTTRTSAGWEVLTTAGDILYATAAGTPARLGIGTARQRLATNSGATAPEWVADTQNTVVDSTGDTIYGTADNTITRLGIGTAGQVYRVNTGATAPEWGSAATLGSEVTASGTVVSVASGVPSWVRRIHVMFDGVSTNGTDQMLIQIGDSGGLETSGYSSGASDDATGTTSTVGFVVTNSLAATDAVHGVITLHLQNSSDNKWAASGTLYLAGSGAVVTISSAGTKALSATLDRVSLTTTGSNAYDSGGVSYSYE